MKRVGRPPLDPSDPSVPVCVVMPGKHYDALVARAKHERVTVAEFIRRKIRAGEKISKIGEPSR